MPTCENCKHDTIAILEITLPKNLSKRQMFKGRIKGKLCFSCIKLYAKTSLRFDGYWHSIIFPQQHKGVQKMSGKGRGRPLK